MEMGVVKHPVILTRLLLILVVYLGIGCKIPKTVSGVYEQFKPWERGPDDLLFQPGFSFERLQLQKDSLFSYYRFNDEVCYRSLAMFSGHWSITEDSIQIIPFPVTDTIAYKTVYKSDNSRELTLELFDQFGGRYIWPSIAYFKEAKKNFKIEFGIYNEAIPKKHEELVVWDANGIGRHVIPIKRDSMHIQIYGISTSGPKSIQHIRLAKNGIMLKGNLYVVGKYNDAYMPSLFYQQRKLKYQKWEKEEIKTDMSVKNRFLHNELERSKQ